MTDDFETSKALQERFTIFGSDQDRDLVDTVSGKDYSALIWSRGNRLGSKQRTGDFTSFSTQIRDRPLTVSACIRPDQRIEIAAGLSQEDARTAWRLSDSTARKVTLPHSEGVNDEGHFIIPLDWHAEQQLEKLMECLLYLPADQKRNIVQVIVRPGILAEMYSLENKIDRLLTSLPSGEQRYAGSSNAAPAEKRSGGSHGHHRGEWWEANLTWVYIAGAAVILTAIVLGIIFYARSRQTEGPDLTAEANKLLSTVNSGSQAISTIHNSAALESLSVTYDSEQWTRFAKEVLKLEMVTHKLVTPATQTEWSDPDRYKETLTLYKTNQGQLSAHKQLMEWVSCKSFENPDMDEKEGANTHRCKFDDANIVAELNGLTGDVEKYRDARGQRPFFAAQAQTLVQAMKKSTVPGVKALYSLYLTDFDESQPYGMNFAKALVKLELLRLKLIQAQSQDLESDTSTDSVAALGDAKSADKIRRIGKNVLLGWMLCQASSNPTLDNAPIPGFSSCTSDSTGTRDDYIRGGFESLTAFTKTGQ